MKVVSNIQMRQIEEKAVSEYGVSTLIMMENAGQAAARFIREAYPLNNLKVVVVAGSGNNGGDGLVVARHLLNAKIPVTTFLLAKIEKLSIDTLTNWQILKQMSQDVFIIEEEEKLPLLGEKLKDCDLIVDALLGTGFHSPLKEFYKKAIETINSFKKPVAALDTPSGLIVDTGLVSNSVVEASLTVTMGLPKIGFFHPQAINHIGQLLVADIGVPRSLLEDPAIKVNLVEKKDLPLLPPRPLNTHKGECGRLFILGGSLRFSGAVILTGMAALESRAGYVSLGVPQEISPLVNNHLLEAVVEPLLTSSSGTLSYTNKNRLKELMAKADTVVIGPGIGQEEETAKLVLELIEEISQPLIIDADGLNILSKDLSFLKRRTAPTLLTPHSGEMSRLVKKSLKEVEEKRFSLILELAAAYNTHLLLKGPYSLIASPGGELFINLEGGPELATAGSGDVLSGLLGSISSQGLDLLKTAILGCYWHGVSGKLAAGELGIIKAGDIAKYLPSAYCFLYTYEHLIKLNIG